MAKAKLIREIVPVEQWIEDEFYLGPEVEVIRPYVKKFVIEYANSITKRKFLCTGASRTGKSYGVRILVQRILYEMSCWENFPCLFGLSPSTVPKLYWMSYTIGKSDSTGIAGLIRMIDKVPYWQLPGLKRKDVSSELIFPFAEVRSGSNVSHIIGEDMLGCILDEANVRKVAKGTEIEETQKMFQEMRQRSVMTFSKNGIWGGFSGIISSATTSSSFVALELEKAKKNNDTVVMEASVYEANPEQYSKETFPVFMGDGEIAPFIIDEADDAIRNNIIEKYGMTMEDYLKIHPEYIENVPVSIREFYEEDLIFSLANMSGKAVMSNSTFISPRTLKKLWNEERCAVKDIPNFGIYDTTDVTTVWDETILDNYHGEDVYLHVDASQKWDKTGITALYLDNEENKIKALICCALYMDKTIPDNQIDQEKILALIIHMRDCGVNFKFLSGDHYAKDYLIPQWKKIFGNDKADYVSVDTTPTPYLNLLNLISMNRMSIPKYPLLEKELSELTYDRGSQKIDHPHNADPKKPVHSKDVADSLAGALQDLYIREHVSIEMEIVKKDIEKVDIPDDGFFNVGTCDTDEEVESFEEELEASLLD